ncbi:MAG: EthD family reductase [Nevskiaceae bacterium]|nr:MAG: EthD family reductase [Nevskiaceae bacterium]TBR74253.1 MAG: EthD family reductase [Nevskiaceae bacterium]
MIKLVYLLAKRQDVSLQDFYTYWRETHSKNVKARQKALRMKKYIQSYTVEPELNDLLRESRGLEPPYPGVTEVWWESAADLKAALATPEGAAAMQFLIDDESRFIDFSHTRVFMTEENTIF